MSNNLNNQMMMTMMNESVNHTLVDGSNDVDLNEKYFLHIIVPILWSIIVLFGIIGNGLVIYIIVKRNLYKNSCTNCYIINLAISDLSFNLVCVPVTMTAYISQSWILGDFLCSFQNLLMFSSVQATCLTLTAMTVDRYVAILYPFKSLEYRTTKVAFCANMFIWIASFILNFPYYLYYTQEMSNSNGTNASNGTTVESPNYYSTSQSYDYQSTRSSSSDYYTIEEGSTTQAASLVSNTSASYYYCVAKFPNEQIEKALTIYTFVMSYALPVIIILFCYIRMIRKFMSSLNNEIIDFRRDNLRVKFRKPDANNKSINDDFETQIIKAESFELLKNPKKSVISFESNPNLSNVNVNMVASSSNGTLTRKSINSNCNNNNNNNKKRKSGEEDYQLSAAYRNGSLPLRDEITTTTNSSTNNELSKQALILLKKKKKKAIFLIALVSLTFALTWLPINVIRVWKVVFSQYFPYRDYMYIIKLISHTLSYSNSLLNPIIYVFIGRKFQDYIRDEFASLFRCCKRQQKPANTRHFNEQPMRLLNSNLKNLNCDPNNC